MKNSIKSAKAKVVSRHATSLPKVRAHPTIAVVETPIAKIPKDVSLTKKQAIIQDVFHTGRPYVSSDLESALSPFGPPAYYPDFETMSPAIPLYPGTKPYERLPFQWSLHQRQKNGDLQHSGFLAEGSNDPREAFVESLDPPMNRSSSIARSSAQHSTSLRMC